MRPQQTKPFAKNEDLLRYFQDLPNKCVIAPTNMATNNISVICKFLYMMRLLKEVGVNDNPDFMYEISGTNPTDLINDDVLLCELFGLFNSKR